MVDFHALYPKFHLALEPKINQNPLFLEIHFKIDVLIFLVVIGPYNKEIKNKILHNNVLLKIICFPYFTCFFNINQKQ